MDTNRDILSAHDINGFSLRNRLAVAPMTRVSATETGLATAEMAQYYQRFAQGGFGLVITEGLYTDQRYAQGYPCQPGITDARQSLAWRAVTDRIHAHDSAVFAQLMHAGALSQGNRFSDHSAAPSAIRAKGEQMRFYFGDGPYPLPKAMSDEDIADAISGFAQAAKRSIDEAGFDGIEIHGANGYLLDQFLTDYTNQRADRWGGDVQQRVGLTLEVIKAVRQAVGAVPVGVRISQGKVNDFGHKWAGGERDAEVIFGSLNDAGVDFIHVTEFEAWKPAFPSNSASLVALARRYAPAASLIANGGLHDSEGAEAVLAAGADMIALGKSALANPDLPTRLAGGKPLAAFDASLLGPIANIKESELAL
ncbi:12-oxophytodienoate reductase 2 [Pseudomonas reidholzensis]|uniref:12-oxophytodienoate reductase 2 n=1 Tax=Pseudomonas reidholzensis TaxID=1785162 RepID=A0A383RV25_9PSED|nr:NADH:flavin oxidoreductase [Pseudomonas reidholzensis]SYX90238.1 12-oxophytodienoate reductase 2 [Pseudomonas reidholzensis]